MVLDGSCSNMQSGRLEMVATFGKEVVGEVGCMVMERVFLHGPSLSRRVRLRLPRDPWVNKHWMEALNTVIARNVHT